MIASFGWLAGGLLLGLIVGWLAAWRSHARRHSRELSKTNAESQRQRVRLATELEELRFRAKEFDTKLGSEIRARQEAEQANDKLQSQLKESRRTSAKAEAKIADREATIDSLRSKLYGAHSSVARLEDELAQHTGMTNGVVVSREAVTLDAYDDLLVDLRDAPRVRPREAPSSSLG